MTQANDADGYKTVGTVSAQSLTLLEKTDVSSLCMCACACGYAVWCYLVLVICSPGSAAASCMLCISTSKLLRVHGGKRNVRLTLLIEPRVMIRVRFVDKENERHELSQGCDKPSHTGITLTDDQHATHSLCGGQKQV